MIGKIINSFDEAIVVVGGCILILALISLLVFGIIEYIKKPAEHIDVIACFVIAFIFLLISYVVYLFI